MTEEKLSTFILDNDFSNTDIDAVLRMFAFLEKRSNEASIQMMLRLSKLPLKFPKTFANFDFSQVHGKNASQLEGLQSLSTLYSHKNVALIGQQESERRTLQWLTATNAASTSSRPTSLRCPS